MTGTEALGADEVRIWCARLDWPDADIRRFESILSLEEKERAKRFHFESDRVRFVARRAVLRTVLGDCLGRAAGDIAFVHGPQGKPELSPACNPHRLCFNTSHSRGLGVIALAIDRAVGIDVEWVKPLPDYEAIARHHFTEDENIALSNVEPLERLQAFFNCWTRKEAFVKAHGGGLTLPLDSFEVSLAPGRPAGLLSCVEEGQLERWSLRSFDPAPGFVGAVVAAGSAWTIRSGDWSQRHEQRQG
jgi:4'-phosphopantetheinyl transferase